MTPHPDPRRIYLRLLDEPPVARSGDDHLENVRRAVERFARVCWETGYPRANARGGWDVVFHVDAAPDEVTFDRWLGHFKADGYRPVL